MVFDCGVVGGCGLGLWVSYDCFGSLGGVYIFLRVIVGNDGLGRGLMRLYGMLSRRVKDVCCDVRDRGGMGRPRGLALCFGVGPQLLFLGIPTNPWSVKRFMLCIRFDS